MPKPTLSKSKYPFLFSNNHNSDQKIVVICDANVLYRVILRNLLMWMALDNLFEMHWTNEIQQEWSRNLLINKPDTDKAKIQKTLLLMREALPNANLASYSCPEDLESKLPDKKDSHVIGAAIACKANFIVTFNLKDFPPDILSPYHIEAIHPDAFILSILKNNPNAFFDCIQKLIAKTSDNFDLYIAKLKNNELVETARSLKLIYSKIGMVEKVEKNFEIHFF